MNDINHNVVVEELIRLFESDLGEFPILHTAIRCLNQQAQDIETHKSMFHNLDQNYSKLEVAYNEEKKISEGLFKSSEYYLGMYERTSEILDEVRCENGKLKAALEAKIDANFSLSVLRSAKWDAVKEFEEKLSHVEGDSVPKIVIKRFMELLLKQYGYYEETEEDGDIY